MKKKETGSTQFVVCLNNDGYKASLEVGKLYRIIPDCDSEANGYIRVVDESGEDYAFAENRFHPIVLPNIVEKVLLTVSQR